MLSGLAGRLAVAAVMCAAMLGAAAAQAQRVALVIGNNQYRSVAALTNPVNDASDVAASLKRLGFEVEEIRDATFEGMRRGLLQFARRARGAEIAIVFYAGHGMEVGGENYLIPIDAELKADVDVDHEAIALKSVTPLVENAAKLGLVILDACRNNPFSAKMQRTVRMRAVSRGLVGVEPSGNVLIAFAAREGTTAADGTGRNSPFTEALLRHVETPGLEINFLFRNVRQEVAKSTRGEQQPFVYGSLSPEPIYLKSPVIAPPVVQGPSPDEVVWSFVKESRDAGQISGFLQQFPNSKLRAEAERRLAALHAETAAAQEAARAAAEVAAKKAGQFEQAELARLLQLELKRIGCYEEPVTGEFGKPARDALQRFAKFAAVNVGASDLSPETLSLIRKFDKRVCPLTCRGDERAEGERCVRIVCPAGQIAAKGACVPDPNKQASPAPARPEAGGTKCFTFNNRRFCE